MVVENTSKSKNKSRNPLDIGHDDALQSLKDRRSFFVVIILLGCFSLIALSGAVYLNTSIQNLFESAIEEGVVWETTRQKLTRLSVLAGRVSAPISDVFITKTVDIEREFMRAEYLEFVKEFDLLTAHLGEKNKETSEQILIYLDDTDASLYEMMNEAEFVFTYLQAKQVELATERMSIASQAFREANRLLGSANQVVQRVSIERFNEDAMRIQKLYVLGSIVIGVVTLCFAIFMVVGIRMVKTLDQNQKKLANSRHILSKTLNSVGDVVIGCDRFGRISEWNQQAELLFGEHLSGQFNILELIPGFNQYVTDNIISLEFGDVLHANHLHAMGAVTSQEADVDTVLLPDEKEGMIAVDLTVARIRILNEDNEDTSAFVFTIRDMREHRRNSARVARSQARLRLQLYQNDLIRQEIAEQAEVLQEAKMKAEASMEAKGRFLAVMSHELRTPMNAILGFSKILQRGELKPSQEEALKRIIDASNHLLGIINDILDMSKIESGGLQLEHRPVLFMSELKAVVQTFGEASKKKNLRFLTYVDPHIPRQLMTDTMRLRQVLTNLLGNAFQFTEHGCVWVKVFPVADEVEGLVLSGQPVNCRLRFEVRDTGIGMSAEQQDRVFDPFTQADTSITRKYGGTGLGLTITQQIIESFGGQIELESVIGQGSCFSFTIPFELVEAENDGPKLMDIDPIVDIVILSDDHRFLEWVEYTFEYTRSDYLHFDDVGAQLFAWWEKAVHHQHTPIIVVDGHLSQYDKASLIEGFGHGNELLASCLYLVGIGVETLKPSEQVYGTSLYMPVFPTELIDAVGHLSLQGRSSGAASATRALAIHEVPLLVGRNILVVDDVLSNRQYLHEILKPTGASVTLVESGLEAIEMCQIRLFDLILMDIHMPNMNGYDTAKSIKGIRYAKKTPVVGLTADSVDKVLADCMKYGMVGCLGKPFSEEELYTTITFLLNNSAQDTKKINAVQFEGLEFDGVVIDIDGALDRINHKTELYQKLIGAFLLRMDDLDDRLKQLVSESTSTDALQYLESMRGTALSVGAVDLSETLGFFESSMEAGHERQLAFDRCGIVLQKTIVAMKTIENKLKGSTNNAQQ